MLLEDRGGRLKKSTEVEHRVDRRGPLGLGLLPHAEERLAEEKFIRPRVIPVGTGGGEDAVTHLLRHRDRLGKEHLGGLKLYPRGLINESFGQIARLPGKDGIGKRHGKIVRRHGVPLILAAEDIGRLEYGFQKLGLFHIVISFRLPRELSFFNVYI